MQDFFKPQLLRFGKIKPIYDIARGGDHKLGAKFHNETLKTKKDIEKCHSDTLKIATVTKQSLIMRLWKRKKHRSDVGQI